MARVKTKGPGIVCAAQGFNGRLTRRRDRWSRDLYAIGQVTIDGAGLRALARAILREVPARKRGRRS